MIRIVRLPLLGLAVCLSAASCTSMKKYRELEARRASLEQEKIACDENLKTANEKIQNLTYSSANESERLNRSLAEREAELQAREKDLQSTKGKVEQLSGDLKTKEQRLLELEKALAEKDAAVNRLRTMVSNALLGFKDSDLTVDIRNGKVYVSLAEQLLFKSGSTKVDPKGQEALQKLAQVLQQQPDVNVVVEGHTDDVPIARGTAGMKDNWDLSVLRATEITRILQNSGVPGERITPSGRSEYAALEKGKTPQIRQKNRRTEIILTPKLDELFQILEKTKHYPPVALKMALPGKTQKGCSYKFSLFY